MRRRPVNNLGLSSEHRKPQRLRELASILAAGINAARRKHRVARRSVLVPDVDGLSCPNGSDGSTGATRARVKRARACAVYKVERVERRSARLANCYFAADAGCLIERSACEDNRGGAIAENRLGLVAGAQADGRQMVSCSNVTCVGRVSVITEIAQ